MDTNTPKPLAYSYRRFSHAKQNEAGSLKRQKDIAVGYCQKHNLQLVEDEQYTFLDRATSAFDGKNLDDKAELRRFHDLVEAGSIPEGSYLIVESLDRLSRQHPRQALPRFLDLLNAGINIVSVNDDKVYKAGKVDELDLIVSIMEMSRSHSESSNKSKRVGKAWRDKQEDARNERKPMGATRPAWLDPVYRDDDKDKLKRKPTHYVVNEAKKQIVKDIFQWTIDGYGREAIARRLNEAGIPSFKGKTWGGSSVAQILKSPTVLGIYQPYSGKGKERVKVGEPITGLYEPIIDERTFYEAQQATTERFITGAKKQSRGYNVWQRILRCTRCHAALNVYTKGAKQPPYLRCYEAGKGKCDARSIRLDRADEVFKELLTKVNSLALVQSDARSLQAQLNEVRGRMAEQQRARAETLDFLRTRPSSTLRAEVADADDEIARLEERELELEKALAADRITNKEDFFARLDLVSKEGRARANELLKRLGILVTAFKEADDSITYQVHKKELKILRIVDTGKTLQTVSYSTDVTMAMFDQGEIREDELEVNVGFNRRLKLKKKPETA
ncbi:recombinase family protein [Massilia sp. CT11-108]|uniref:recombinase family protein n=1 Tax=Massilia sp. CT11-108 TaxID=3393900 RepID=UPI0039A4AFF4